jgi:hypothetical protein
VPAAGDSAGDSIKDHSLAEDRGKEKGRAHRTTECIAQGLFVKRSDVQYENGSDGVPPGRELRLQLVGEHPGGYSTGAGLRAPPVTNEQRAIEPACQSWGDYLPRAS